MLRTRDRSVHDPSYRDFVTKAAGIGITTVVTPIRRECLDHLIVWNERHLRRVLREYLAYCNAVRPHQSLANQPRRAYGTCQRAEPATDL